MKDKADKLLDESLLILEHHKDKDIRHYADIVTNVVSWQQQRILNLEIALDTALSLMIDKDTGGMDTFIDEHFIDEYDGE